MPDKYNDILSANVEMRYLLMELLAYFEDEGLSGTAKRIADMLRKYT